MSVMFREFLQRFTGGVYDHKDSSFGLYYWTPSYPNLKKVTSINLRLPTAIKAIREGDGVILNFDGSYLDIFEIFSIKRSPLVAPGDIVIGIKRRAGR